MVTGPSILDWQALLPQTDCATRAVSQNLVNRCTTVGTSCTTNPEEIEVMELQDYSWPTSNKLCASSNYVSIVVSAAHTLDVDKFCWRHHRRVVAKFSQLRVCDMVPEGSTLIFRGTHECWTGLRKLPRQNQLDSSSRSDTIPACDRQTHDDSIHRTSIASRNKNEDLPFTVGSFHI